MSAKKRYKQKKNMKDACVKIFVERISICKSSRGVAKMPLLFIFVLNICRKSDRSIRADIVNVVPVSQTTS